MLIRKIPNATARWLQCCCTQKQVPRESFVKFRKAHKRRIITVMNKIQKSTGIRYLFSAFGKCLVVVVAGVLGFYSRSVCMYLKTHCILGN